jgi:hypothetical protein
MSFQSFQSHKCSDESLTTGSSRHTWPLLTAVTLSLLLILPCIYTSFFSTLGRTGFEICKPWFLFCQNARPLLPLLQGFVCQKKKERKNLQILCHASLRLHFITNCLASFKLQCEKQQWVETALGLSPILWIWADLTHFWNREAKMGESSLGA